MNSSPLKKPRSARYPSPRSSSIRAECGVSVPDLWERWTTRAFRPSKSMLPPRRSVLSLRSREESTSGQRVGSHEPRLAGGLRSCPRLPRTEKYSDRRSPSGQEWRSTARATNPARAITAGLAASCKLASSSVLTSQTRYNDTRTIVSCITKVGARSLGGGNPGNRAPAVPARLRSEGAPLPRVELRAVPSPLELAAGNPRVQ
jgi:hypothetical protein